VLGHIQFLEGLEVSREYIYAGRTDNMRRRLSEHTHLTEKNAPLQKYLRTTKREIHVWYSTDFPLDEIPRVEKTLIRDLNPKFNRIKYLRGEDE
jgi:predicted GIY-YIG superfamily endonuclease